MIIMLLPLLILLPSCAWKKITSDSEKNSLKHQLYNRTQSYIPLHELGDVRVATLLEKELKRNEAVYIALNDSTTIQGAFDFLGIARADVVQAGLFSNPQLSTVFTFPTKHVFQASVSAAVTMNVADLWQVPLRKKIAQSDLEIATQDVLNTIFDTIQQTKQAYNAYLYARETLKTVEHIIEQAEHIKERIITRKSFGYTSDLDINLANVMVTTWRLKHSKYTRKKINALLALKNAMSMTVDETPLPIDNDFFYRYKLDPVTTYIQYAMENRPELIIAQLKIQQAHDSIKYEKSRFIKEFNVGFEYQRNDDGSRERGPVINLDIPIFDNNYAQIARAHFELKGYKIKYSNIQGDITEQIYDTYNKLKQYEQQLLLDDDRLSAYKKAIEYADQYSGTMQLNFVTMFQTYLDYYSAQKKQIKRSYKYMNTIAQLERVIGKTLEPIDSAEESAEPSITIPKQPNNHKHVGH